MFSISRTKIYLAKEDREVLEKAQQLLCEINTKVNIDGSDSIVIENYDIIENISNLCDNICSYCGNMEED